jgi:hypothetical protein
VSSAVKWLQRWRERKSAAPKPRGGSISPLEECATEILALVSAARSCLGERSRPQSARRTAWRTLVPAEAVPAEFREPVVNLWIGLEAHVHYPVRAGRAINIVAIAADGRE